MDTSALTGVDPTSEVATEYTTKVLELAHDQAKQNGEQAVALIESAAPQPPPPGPDGKGALLNKYA
jgi:hypothetical protein